MASQEIHKFRLPIPPTANLIWRTNYRQRKTYMNPIYKQWLRDCSLIIPRINPNGKKFWDLKLVFGFYFVKKIANMDVDNRIKPLVDFIKDRIQIDDRFNKNGSWQRIDIKAPKKRKDHYCEVTVTLY